MANIDTMEGQFAKADFYHSLFVSCALRRWNINENPLRELYRRFHYVNVSKHVYVHFFICNML